MPLRVGSGVTTDEFERQAIEQGSLHWSSRTRPPPVLSTISALIVVPGKRGKGGLVLAWAKHE